MDPLRFDSLTKGFLSVGTRRGLLLRLAPLPLASVLTLLLGREATQADGSGAITGGGNHRRNRGNNNHHHTRDNGDDKCNKKCGSCAQCKNGKCKARPDGRACEGNGVCSDGTCVKGSPAATCPGLGQDCTTAPGTKCCPDVNPKVVCAGIAFQTCQDCTKEPTAEGALCNDSPGNQCCGGNLLCFVGIRVDGGQARCYDLLASANGCPSADDCGGDADCPSGRECVQASDDCCEGRHTLCAVPCPAG
jgi:hypothetical protein